MSAFIHLLGPAGVGKLTIARALAPHFSAKVIDNHWINNPVFGLLDNDRFTPYPTAIWAEIGKVRDAVLTTIVNLSQPDASYIFTNVLFEDDKEDRLILHQFMDAARRRKSPYIPIRLQCTSTELAKRITSPERAARLKNMDSTAAHSGSIRAIIKTGSSNEFTLDTTSRTPMDSAGMIAAHVEAICGRQ